MIGTDPMQVGENAKSRRDTYLYGHPKGPRKRYRSPADFLPHVKWLSMDVTLDPINCLCSACKGGPPPPLPPTVQPLGYLQGPSPPACATPTIPPAVQPPANRRQAMPPKRQTFPSTTTAVQSPVRVQSPLATQSPVLMSGAPAAVAYSSPHAPVPPVPPVAPIANLMASPTHLEREHDLQFPGLNIYRFGEMVWFQIHPHWAIGIVVEVPASADSCYKIQPLHSPLLCEQAEPHIDIPSTRLRPWVAWSTPAITNPNLDQGGKVEYENLPWSQEAHSSSVEVDASIIKSRDVDVSFSLIDKLTDYNQYAGVYYGAERFWVGDAVRLKASRAASIEVASGREILVVVSIYDQTPLAAAGVRAPQTGVRVTGDVYRLESHAQLIPPPSELPTAVSADLSARSRFVITSTVAPYWTYVLVARQITVRLEDVKGRWYPGSSLFRIMQGHDRFQKLVETRGLSLQEWDETGSKMNEMGTGGSGSLNGYRRFGHRHEAFVKAIPSRVVFTPLLQETATIENNMQSLGLAPHSATAAQQPPNPSAQNMHSLSAPVTIIDLTVDDNEGMEFLADHDSIDEEFMKRMGEDAASFLNNDGDFYGGL